MEKFCPSCKNTLDASLFNLAKRRDGLRSYCKSCESGYVKAKTNKIKERIFEKLGKTCSRCGFSDRRALQIDHVNGGGNREHKEIRGAYTFLQKVLSDETGAYQILCANCNWIKRYERAEHAKNPQMSEEGRENIRRANCGRVYTPEQLQRMSDSHKGQIISTEHRQKFREATTQNWKDPAVRKARIDGITGTKWTAEQKEAFREVARTREANKKIKKLAKLLIGFALMEQGIYAPA